MRPEWLRQGSAPWEMFEKLAESDAGVRGNLIPDAHIAALCMMNGATIATPIAGSHV